MGRSDSGHPKACTAQTPCRLLDTFRTRQRVFVLVPAFERGRTNGANLAIARASRPVGRLPEAFLGPLD